MNVSKRFIDRPIATSMLMVALVVMGIITYPMLPVSALPRVDFPTIQVSVNYPGASPDTMAALVAAPLERQFAQIPGVTQMTSSNSTANTQVTLQFELGRNLDGAAMDVQTAINSASGQLPRDLPASPSYRKYNPADSPILILAVTSDTLPITDVDDAADTILGQQISQLSGVGIVQIGGEQKPAVRVEINPDKMAALGVGFEDVRNALVNASVERPKGTLNDLHKTFTLDANDQIKTAPEYNNVIVQTNNGAPARISDIGQAMAGPENLRLAAWFNTTRALVLTIFRQPGADVIATVDRITAVLPELEREMPQGVKVTVVVDRTQSIRASVHEVTVTLILSVFLVMMVIFVFLRNVWGTIIPSIAVPIAIIASFAVMYLLNYSIDNLSLMGLTIAVGFVVDDAIVMIENIERHMQEQGLSAREAAEVGASEIGFTIISISISLIAVFIPLLLMSGYIGELFREFAVTVSAAVVISLFVSLSLTPMMSARFLSHGQVEHGKLYTALENFFDWILNRYETSLKVVLRHQGWTLVAFGGAFVLTVVLFLSISKGFFPEQDTGAMQGTVEAAPEVAFVDMIEKAREAIDIIDKDPGVSGTASFVGSGGGGTSNSGRINIALKPRDERDASAQQIIARLRPKLAGILGARTFLQANQDIRVGGRNSKALYQYTLMDTNQDEMNEWAPKALAKIRTLPMVADVTSDQDELMPQLSLSINRDSASRLGVTPSSIDDTLNDAFGQRQVSTIFSSINQYHVVMEVDSRDPLGPDALSRIYVKSTTGQMVPLSAVATLNRNTAPPSINHQNSFPSVTISFNLIPGASLGDAVNAVSEAMADLGAPTTLQGSFQGTAQAFQSSLSTIPLLILAALAAIYVVLAILYESLVHPITILSTLPSAGVGGLLILFIFGQDFTVMALIGIILLMGIVKKNGIMLVDFALEAERVRKVAPEEAVYEACVKRFRPILMTTVAALLTGVPLAIGFGSGAELRKPLGLTIVGGLIFSQVMTLYTTPVIYLALDRFQTRVTNFWRTRFGGRKHAEERPHHESPDRGFGEAPAE